MMNVKKPILCPFFPELLQMFVFLAESRRRQGSNRGRQRQRKSYTPSLFLFLFFLSMLRQQGERGTKETERGQRRDSQGETVVFLTSSQEGGGWKRRQRTTSRSLFQVRGSDMQLASRFLPPKSSFFILLFYKQNLPIKCAPAWRPPGFGADFLFLVAVPLTRITG